MIINLLMDQILSQLGGAGNLGGAFGGVIYQLN
jgi:hypothetical protein